MTNDDPMVQLSQDEQPPHIDQPGDTEPPPQPAPPKSVSAAVQLVTSKDVMPRRYVVHRHSQICKNCGTLHDWSCTYAQSDMHSRTGSGKLVVHLVPVTEFSYNLPIETICVSRKQIAVCHECSTTASLSHLPDPTNSEEWQRIYSVAAAPEQAKYNFGSGRAVTPKKPPKTIDDLLF